MTASEYIDSFIVQWGSPIDVDTAPLLPDRPARGGTMSFDQDPYEKRTQLEECLAEIRRLKSLDVANKSLEDEVKACLHVLDMGLEIQPNSALHRCIRNAYDRLEDRP